MKLYLNNSEYIETNDPLDLSISISNHPDQLRAWYVETPEFEPVRTDQFTGSVIAGGSVNFNNLLFNPHGHGTHTECVGHIDPQVYSVNQSLKKFLFKALLITISPVSHFNEQFQEADLIITPDLINLPDNVTGIEALIIRTTPNSMEKRHRNYSGTNPPYLDVSCAEKINQAGIQHLLVDLPSVDREADNGALAFHKRFWNWPKNPTMEKTISELIYAGDHISDGMYILDLQFAAIENDASPSRPVLYKIKKAE